MGEPDAKPEGIADPGKEARAEAGIPIVPAFDSWRALAIAGVVLLHLILQSGSVVTGQEDLLAKLTWGTVGHAIDVLFVVSGFVVFLPTAARRSFGSLRRYATRRAARLLPAYWLILAIMLLLIAVTDSVRFPDPGDVAAHLFGLQGPAGMLFSGTTNGFSVNPPVWTLSVEICFYIVLPLVAGFWLRKPWLGLLLAAVLTVTWNETFQHFAEVNEKLGLGLTGEDLLRIGVTSGLQFPSWAFSFGLGMTGAWAYVRLRNRTGPRHDSQVRVARVIGLLGLLFFAWLTALDSGDAPAALVIQISRTSPLEALGYSAFLALTMVSFSLGSKADQSLLASPRLRKLGDISYGIFLSHMVIVYCWLEWAALPENGSIGAFAIWTVAVVPASVLYGYLSARFLEQPIRRWAGRYGRREEAPGLSTRP